MTRSAELGARGEKEACRYLVGRRYRIVERNARRAWGEIDIVATAADGTLVFVEVKTMRDRGPRGLTPEDQMSAGKLRRFRRAAALYASGHENLVDSSKGWRLDVLTLTLRDDDSFAVGHYENV